MAVDMRKKALRRRMKALLSEVSHDQLVDGKIKLFESLWHTGIFGQETRLMGFHPWGNEADCSMFLRIWLTHGRTLFLPRVAADKNSLEVWQVPDIHAVLPGYKGIPEPDPEKCTRANAIDIDAILVPGLAFDKQGRRLGRGSGHYDRFLPNLRVDVHRVGVGWDWQLSDDELPSEDHDQLLHTIATPNGIHRCN